MKNRTRNLNRESKQRKVFKAFSFVVIFIGLLLVSTPVFAEGETTANDPITVVNNLSDFIFQLTKVIGGIIVGYSIVQIGLSFTSHDASQRVNGFLFFAGGVIIMFAKTILNLIAG